MMVGSTLSDTLTGVLPFLLLIGFWIYLLRGKGFRSQLEAPTVAKLEEIRQELERIRRAVEQDPYRS
jgi:hypothetical protein